MLYLTVFFPGSNHPLLVGPCRQLLHLLQWAHTGPERVWRPAGTDAKGLQSEIKLKCSFGSWLVWARLDLAVDCRHNGSWFLLVTAQPPFCSTFGFLFELDVDMKRFPVSIFKVYSSPAVFTKAFTDTNWLIVIRPHCCKGSLDWHLKASSSRISHQYLLQLYCKFSSKHSCWSSVSPFNCWRPFCRKSLLWCLHDPKLPSEAHELDVTAYLWLHWMSVFEFISYYAAQS